MIRTQTLTVNNRRQHRHNYTENEIRKNGVGVKNCCVKRAEESIVYVKINGYTKLIKKAMDTNAF
jgi:hypothetical protein